MCPQEKRQSMASRDECCCEARMTNVMKLTKGRAGISSSRISVRQATAGVLLPGHREHALGPGHVRLAQRGLLRLRA